MKSTLGMFALLVVAALSACSHVDYDQKLTRAYARGDMRQTLSDTLAMCSRVARNQVHVAKVSAADVSFDLTGTGKGILTYEYIVNGKRRFGSAPVVVYVSSDHRILDAGVSSLQAKYDACRAQWTAEWQQQKANSLMTSDNVVALQEPWEE